MLTLPLCKNVLLWKDAVSWMQQTGENKNVTLFIWNMLAHFCFTETTLSWSELAQNLTKWKWRSRMYIPVFTHSTISCVQLRHWEQSRICTSSLVKWKKLWFLGQDSQMFIQNRNKWYNLFLVTIKRIDNNTVQPIYRTNIGTKCIFTNLG